MPTKAEYKKIAAEKIASLQKKVDVEIAKKRSRRTGQRIKKELVKRKPREISKGARKSAQSMITTLSKGRVLANPEFKLTIRHHVFAQEYIKDLSITKAAGRMKCSKQAIKRWLKEPDVLQLIEDEMARRAERQHMSQDEVITELSAMGRVKISDVLSFDGKTITMKASADLPPEVLSTIESVQEVVTKYGGRQLRLKFYDKKGALELLGRHFGMFLDRQKVEEDLTINIVRYDGG